MPSIIADGENPSGIAWSKRVLWTDPQSASAGLRFANDAAQRGALDTQQPSLAVAAAEETYLVQKNGELVKVLGDPPSDFTTIFPFPVFAERVSTRTGAVAWASSDGAVHMCNEGACVSEAASRVSNDRATALVMDASSLFWGVADGRIRSVARSATGFVASVLEIASGLSEPSSLAPDESGPFLYFCARGTAGASYTDGVVGKVAKGGGEMTILARGQARPESVVVTNAHVYWANGYDGTIRRLPK